MTTQCLQFFVTESAHHAHKPVYAWLLETAKNLGVPGGTAIRALAGYGRHGWQDSGFFELAGEVPVEVTFFLDAPVAESLLDAVRAAGLKLVYARFPVTLDITG